MAAFTREIDPGLVIALHSQGQVIYWGFQGLEPPEAEGIVQRLGRVSRYQPVRYAGSAAGYKDWFIQEYRRPGFTVEVGRGTNPLPLQQFDAIYSRLEPLLWEGLES